MLAFIKDQLQLPGFSFLVTELSLEVPEAGGVLLPSNVRELNDALRTRHAQIHLRVTGMKG